MKRAIIVVVIIAAIGAGAGAYYMRRNGGEVQVSTSPITRGEIVDAVGSTGTLQAVTTVQVGTQVSGNIAWLGADFNSIVKKGQVIARIDPSILQAQVEQARANLTRAQADLERNRVALEDAQTKYARARELAARSLLPQSDLDSAKVAVDAARAQLQSSQAAVVQAQASLSQNQVNLDHCVITAPIDGIVIQRSVDVGQTVAASLSSPTLFIIAADLTKMQVNANIDEADVGRIRPGQNVTFRVDAYPNDDFTGVVSQVRLQPVVLQNVTTYATIINVPNAALKLKPGMTANLRVQIARRADALRVPNTALRFRPTTEMFTALNQPVPPEMLGGGRGRGGFGPSSSAAPQANPVSAAPQAQQAPKPSPASQPSQASQAAPQPASGAKPAMPAAFERGSSAPSLPPGQGPAGDGQFRRGGEGFGGGSGRGGGFGGGGFGGGGFGGNDPERQARLMERFKGMSPDEQRQFVARIKERGGDTSAFDKASAPAAKAKGPKQTAAPAADTIDQLFAPLPPVESSGRVWLWGDKQLKPLRVRLGVTDGTNTELLSTDLQEGAPVVIAVTLPGAATRAQTGAAGAGNPLLPQGGRGPGGFGGGGFPGGGGGGRGR